MPLPPKESVSAETFLERTPTCSTRRADALRLIAEGPGQSDWLQLVAGNQARAIAITPRTAQTRWLGERMHYGMAVDHLLGLERQRAAGG